METLAGVAAVAEGLVFGEAAAAEANGFAAAQPKRFAFGVDDGHIAFDAQRAVIEYGDFYRHLGMVAE